MRFHPIHQVWRKHSGVDYGAPEGTPIRTTGDGVVSFVGQRGGYGKVVEIKHWDNYSTLYAHMSRFAPGLRVGSKIAQGDLIGFVGSTGWATGPHLHYEFKIGKVAHDPLRIALPQAPPLLGARMRAFKTHTATARHQIALMRTFQIVQAD